jgi:hypothetical protein
MLVLLAPAAAHGQGLTCGDDYRQKTYDAAAKANSDCIQEATPRLELSGAAPQDVAIAALYECRVRRTEWLLAAIACKPNLNDPARVVDDLSRDAAIDGVIEIRAARHNPFKPAK